MKLFNIINALQFWATISAVLLAFFMLNETEPGVKEFVNDPVIYAILSILIVTILGCSQLLKEIIEQERKQN